MSRGAERAKLALAREPPTCCNGFSTTPTLFYFALAMKHKSKFSILTGAVPLLVALVAIAGQTIPLTVPQLVGKSQVILHGVVRSKTVQRDPQRRIYTRIELEVNEVWKGDGVTNRFRLVQAGGILGEEGMAVEGQAEFNVGEEVVAFMVLNARGEGVILGLSQGKFEVSADPVSGERLVRNSFHGGSPPDFDRTVPATSAGQRRLALAELKAQVKGGRP